MIDYMLHIRSSVREQRNLKLPAFITLVEFIMLKVSHLIKNVFHSPSTLFPLLFLTKSNNFLDQFSLAFWLILQQSSSSSLFNSITNSSGTSNGSTSNSSIPKVGNSSYCFSLNSLQYPCSSNVAPILISLSKPQNISFKPHNFTWQSIDSLFQFISSSPIESLSKDLPTSKFVIFAHVIQTCSKYGIFKPKSYHASSLVFKSISVKPHLSVKLYLILSGNKHWLRNTKLLGIIIHKFGVI